MAPKRKTVSNSSSNGEVPYFGLTKFLVLKLALPHVCLWTIAVLYCMTGAFVFMHLEARESRQTSQYANRSIDLAANDLVAELSNLTTEDDRISTLNESAWKTIGDESMRRFTIRIYELYKKLDQSRYLDPTTGATDEKWAFGRSFFFAATTLTSIGYGNQTPSTRSGKVFCIFYALFGLPLVVITIADIAKFLSHFILWCFIRYLMLKWKLRACYHTWRLKRLERRESIRLQKKHGISPREAAAMMASPKGKSDEEVAEFLWVNLVNAEFVEVPASLMFALITSYVALGGWYFRTVEKDWTFFEGFYFSLISILAIGFGDYTPRNERFIYVSLVYVIMGIVLTTTCIDIVGVDYINKLHFWGRQLHKVDPLQWLKDVQERRLRNMKRKAMTALINTLTALHYMRLDQSLLGNMRSLLVEKDEQDESALNMPNSTLVSPKQSIVGSPNDPNQPNDRSPPEAISLAVAAAAAAQLAEKKAIPNPPRNFRAVSISVHSVTLKWEPPSGSVLEDTYYSLSYRLRSVCDHNLRKEVELDQSNSSTSSVVQSLIASSLGLMTFATECLEFSDDAGGGGSEDEAGGEATARSTPRIRLAPRRVGMTGIEHIPFAINQFTVNGLKSFALYQFSLVVVNKNGRSRSVHTQEYTEPSTVPLNIRASSISDTLAKIVWDAPARNKIGPRRYTLHITSDATIPFGDWDKIETTSDEQQQIDLSNLTPSTSYVACVSANHNRGLATFSRSLQLATLATPTSGGGDQGDDEQSLTSPAGRSTRSARLSSSIGGGSVAQISLDRKFS